MSLSLTPVPFERLPGWGSDDPTPIIEGLKDCAGYVESVKPYKTGSLGIEVADFTAVFAAAGAAGTPSARFARAFFEAHFQPFHIVSAAGEDGFVTAYYEPELDVASEPSDRYRHPIYRQPADLVALDENNRPSSMDPSFAFGRQTAGGIEVYADRCAIDRGFLHGRGLEIAWASSRIEVFFMHVQGSARLCFEDGRVRRVTYAAKTGHPYRSIGRVLIDWGELAPADVTMETIRRWLVDNPDRADDLLWHNRSYIFFREAPVIDPNRGPVAAAKVPLLAGRSLAVDRFIHTYGTPFYIQADRLTHLPGGPFRRLMVAQDTGSAIVGPARGDIFIGSGGEAGTLAGSVKHPAVFFIFVPKPAVGRLIR